MKRQQQRRGAPHAAQVPKLLLRVRIGPGNAGKRCESKGPLRRRRGAHARAPRIASPIPRGGASARSCVHGHAAGRRRRRRCARTDAMTFTPTLPSPPPRGPTGAGPTRYGNAMARRNRAPRRAAYASMPREPGPMDALWSLGPRRPSCADQLMNRVDKAMGDGDRFSRSSLRHVGSRAGFVVGNRLELIGAPRKARSSGRSVNRLSPAAQTRRARLYVISESGVRVQNSA